MWETFYRYHELTRRRVFSPREVTAQGERRVTDSQTACDPRVVFLVVVGLCSGAVLEQVFVGQAVVTSSPAFSANLESATPPTFDT